MIEISSASSFIHFHFSPSLSPDSVFSVIFSFLFKGIQSTVLSTSLGKTFFAWRFILNENILF